MGNSGFGQIQSIPQLCKLRSCEGVLAEPSLLCQLSQLVGNRLLGPFGQLVQTAMDDQCPTVGGASPEGSTEPVPTKVILSPEQYQ